MTANSRGVWEQSVNRFVRWGLRHWLLVANSLVLLYAGLPWLAPLAQATGHERLGRLIFMLYTPLCHQRPERSFFLCGHQVAFCHRCAAMYTSIFVIGLLFGLVRRWIKPLPVRIGGLLALPMLLDGGTHLIDDLFGLGFRGGGDAIGTINFWLRMVTGVLIGIAVLVTLYPRLEREFLQETARMA